MDKEIIDSTAHTDCKFNHKQKVMIRKGYYKGLKGHITGVFKDKVDDKDVIVYKVETQDGMLNIKEEYLNKRYI